MYLAATHVVVLYRGVSVYTVPSIISTPAEYINFKKFQNGFNLK